MTPRESWATLVVTRLAAQVLHSRSKEAAQKFALSALNDYFDGVTA